MASTSKHSRFSTFKVFKFTGSKPPPPPPKDANYVYSSSSLNHSLLSFSSPHSVHGKTTASSSLSVRTPSPSPSRAIQPSPCDSASVSTLSPDQCPNKGKGGFFRKISGLRKRSASKNSRVANPDDTTDDEDISPPWNFQVSSPRPVLGMALKSPSFLLFFFYYLLHALARNVRQHNRTHTHIRPSSIIYT
jgi:hypothetical protein